ncbi:MAG: sugar-binding transcriptional regulator [Pseudomonadota bacterium]
MTQAAVAERLGMANVKAHRLITRANQAGIVKVTIDGQIAECVELEGALAQRFGLSYCEVAPDLFESALPVRALGIAGATFLQREIESGRNTMIGFGHGRTLAAIVQQLPHLDAGATKFVSLLGGLTRNYAANPHDVMFRLADKTRAAAYFMPVPFFANSTEDREVLLSQRGVSDVLEMAARSELKLVGIGSVENSASLVSVGMIASEEIADMKAKGGVGEVLGYFFDAHGEAIDTGLTARTLSVALDALEGTRVVAVAGGDEKIGAIRSVLLSGRLSGLITDERTATALMATAR